MTESFHTDLSQSDVNPAVFMGGINEAKARVTGQKYKDYEEAQLFADSLKLKSRKEWREYVKGARSGMPVLPADVPAHPDGIYKTKGWQGWRQWLGTDKPTHLH